MAYVIYVSGGQRSGKSSYAEKLIEEKTDSPIYLATSRIWDEDFKKRVSIHQSRRGKQWQTIEEEVHLSCHNLTGKMVLMDCVTLWLTNIFHDNEYQIEPSLQFAKEEWQKFIQQDFNLVVVSNEIGMGVHSEHSSARKFVDLQGWTNQFVANTANEAYLMVSGMPLKVK